MPTLLRLRDTVCDTRDSVCHTITGCHTFAGCSASSVVKRTEAHHHGGQRETQNFSEESLLCRHRRAVTLDLCLEIAQTVPVKWPAEVHLRDGNAAPLFRLRHHTAIVSVDPRDHPVIGSICVCAADHLDVVLTSSRGSQHWIAAPYGPGDHFGTIL